MKLKENAHQQHLLNEELDFKDFIDAIETCISATNKENKEIYCERASQLYSKLESIKIYDSWELNKNKAYHSMLDIAKAGLRRFENRKEIENPLSKQEEIEKILLEHKYAAQIIVFINALILTFAFLFFKRETPDKNKNKHIKSRIYNQNILFSITGKNPSLKQSSILITGIDATKNVILSVRPSGLVSDKISLIQFTLIGCRRGINSEYIGKEFYAKDIKIKSDKKLLIKIIDDKNKFIFLSYDYAVIKNITLPFPFPLKDYQEFEKINFDKC